MSIGTKIHKLMKQKSVSQETLASNLGVSQKAIHDIISGKTQKIDFLFMHKVCEVFNVGFDYFLDDNQTYNVKKNLGGAVGNNATVNNYNTPEGILENMLKRLELLEKIIQQNK